jgi:hypothetical protein
VDKWICDYFSLRYSVSGLGLHLRDVHPTPARSDQVWHARLRVSLGKCRAPGPRFFTLSKPKGAVGSCDKWHFSRYMAALPDGTLGLKTPSGAPAVGSGEWGERGEDRKKAAISEAALCTYILYCTAEGHAADIKLGHLCSVTPPPSSLSV